MYLVLLQLRIRIPLLMGFIAVASTQLLAAASPRQDKDQQQEKKEISSGRVRGFNPNHSPGWQRY
jgi:hypothetical protein